MSQAFKFLKLTIPNLMLSNLIRLFLLPKRRLLDFTLLKLFYKLAEPSGTNMKRKNYLLQQKKKYLQNSIANTQGGSILLGDGLQTQFFPLPRPPQSLVEILYLDVVLLLLIHKKFFYLVLNEVSTLSLPLERNHHTPLLFNKSKSLGLEHGLCHHFL